MKEIIVPIEKFDFQRFEDKSIEFAKQVLDTDYAVAWVEKSGDIPEYEINYLDRSSLLEALNQGKALFFMFTNTNTGDSINCVDGEGYEIDEESDFCLGDADCVGYLLQIKNGVLTINSAVNSGGACTFPPPSLDIEINCDVFDKPMEKFIKRFIN